MTPSLEKVKRVVEKNNGNKAQAARELGIPRTTLLSILDRQYYKSNVSELVAESKIKRENTLLRKQVKELLELTEKQERRSDIIEQIKKPRSSQIKWKTPKRKKKDSAIITAFMSDWHFHEVVNPEEINFINAYNEEIADLRLGEFFKNVISLSQTYINGIHVDGLVLPLGGDMVSGNIHEELRETNVAPITVTLLRYSTLIAKGIRMLAEVFPNIYIPCCVGNHGRMQEQKRFKNKPKDNFDYLLYHMIARECKDLDNVTFDIGAMTDVKYEVYGWRYQLTHGDQFSGGDGMAGLIPPLLRGDYKKRKKEQIVGTPYDFLIIGHFHQLNILNNLVTNGSGKGYDEYASDHNLAPEPAQQAFWLTDADHGITIKAPIHVVSKEEPWRKDRI